MNAGNDRVVTDGIHPLPIERFDATPSGALVAVCEPYALSGAKLLSGAVADV